MISFYARQQAELEDAEEQRMYPHEWKAAGQGHCEEEYDEESEPDQPADTLGEAHAQRGRNTE